MHYFPSLPFSPSFLPSFFSSFLPPLCFSLSHVPCVLPPTLPPLHPLQLLSLSNTREAERVQNSCHINMLPARVKAYSGCPTPLPPILGAWRECLRHPHHGISGDRIGSFYQAGEFLGSQAMRQISLILYFFLFSFMLSIFISKENNVLVYSCPVYNNSFSKIIAVFLLIIWFWKQLKDFCFILFLFLVPFGLSLYATEKTQWNHRVLNVTWNNSSLCDYSSISMHS